jgi:molecular chaperone DnaJ
MSTTLYETLGVPKNATQDEIKKAYRKLARQHHPDRNPGDESAEAKFKEVQTAYDVLSHAEKRKQYDAVGNGRARAGGAGGVPFDFNMQDFDLGDMFGGIFNRGQRGGARRQQPQRGADIEAVVNLSFEDSLKGVQTQIPVEVETACRECGGSGAQPGTAPIICPECNGRGVLSESQGLFSLSQPCPRCRGNGTVIEQPCPRCRGTGRERRTKRYSVKIPAGVKDGTRIASRQGRVGGERRPPGDRTVTRAPRRSTSVAARLTLWSTPVSFPTAAWAQRRAPTPGSLAEFLPAPRTASCCASRAAARRS